jgi:hypothetical protein
VAKRFDWTSAYWTAPQLAAYLGVSPSFVIEKIKAGLVQVAKGGVLVDAPGEREYYQIARDEVRRVIRELPIPPTREALGERLARFAKREGKDLPFLIHACNQLVDLELVDADEVMRQWMVVLSTRSRGARRISASNASKGDEYMAAESKLGLLKASLGVGPGYGKSRSR